MPKTALIVGGGISGCTAALTLSKLGIKCTVYELRDVPATIGGAVNLTPNALRILESLEVEISGCQCDAIEIFSLATGSKIAELGFKGKSGPAKRVERAVLQRGLLEAVERVGVGIIYGAKLVEVTELGGKVDVKFESGSSAAADFLVGCDGIYSAVRMSYVEPERKPIYTGMCTAYAIVQKAGVTSDIHFQQTAVNSSRFGALLTSYTDPEKTRIYLGAVMETTEQCSRDGWKTRGLDREMTAKEVQRRYATCAFACLPELIAKAEDWIFYPVCKLGAGGRWSKGRVILLGDAAHGMPPQGESTGLAIEDPVLLAQVLAHFPDKSLGAIFESYEKTRRPRIDTAYKEAVFRWVNVKDKSWLWQKFEEWLTWMYIWYRADFFEKSMAYDIGKERIIE
ncbi:oxidoreductase [Hyphodiscus hymeniophilus]|uniref:Oxidoreductase n=1 Tax=Hyphodiscus hymeniophilus TaxID=353542 RepID=A0A9P6VJW9_9HELO|nr:oxidoreductase [Hyphodiscus hymeniophilus]